MNEKNYLICDCCDCCNETVKTIYHAFEPENENYIEEFVLCPNCYEDLVRDN